MIKILTLFLFSNYLMATNLMVRVVSTKNMTTSFSSRYIDLYSKMSRSDFKSDIKRVITDVKNCEESLKVIQGYIPNNNYLNIFIFPLKVCKKNLYIDKNKNLIRFYGNVDKNNFFHGLGHFFGLKHGYELAIKRNSKILRANELTNYFGNWEHVITKDRFTLMSEKKSKARTYNAPQLIKLAWIEKDEIHEFRKNQNILFSPIEDNLLKKEKKVLSYKLPTGNYFYIAYTHKKDNKHFFKAYVSKEGMREQTYLVQHFTISKSKEFIDQFGTGFRFRLIKEHKDFIEVKVSREKIDCSLDITYERTAAMKKFIDFKKFKNSYTISFGISHKDNFPCRGIFPNLDSYELLDSAGAHIKAKILIKLSKKMIWPLDKSLKIIMKVKTDYRGNALLNLYI